MASRKTPHTEPLGVLELLRVWQDIARDGKNADGWYPEHRARVLDALAGAPLRGGKDGRRPAAEIAIRLDTDPKVREAARLFLAKGSNR